jgi:hypothetical protein
MRISCGINFVIVGFTWRFRVYHLFVEGFGQPSSLVLLHLLGSIIFGVFFSSMRGYHHAH